MRAPLDTTQRRTGPSAAVASARALAAAVAVVATALVAAIVPTRAAEAAACWAPAVRGTVTDPFGDPPCPYCAGNRAVDYRVGDRAPVRAVAPGTVEWTGAVAGVRYVTVRHGDGTRTTSGHLVEVAVSAGERVLTGTRLGLASGRFSLSLRDGSVYLDPLDRIGRLVGRPRLVPVDGTRPRPSPPPRPSCAAPAGGAAGARRR